MVRQGLSSRRPVGVTDAVRSVLALQAQEPAAPYLALWNRIDGFDAIDLDRALADIGLTTDRVDAILDRLSTVMAEPHGNADGCNRGEDGVIP